MSDKLTIELDQLNEEPVEYKGIETVEASKVHYKSSKNSSKSSRNSSKSSRNSSKSNLKKPDGLSVAHLNALANSDKLKNKAEEEKYTTRNEEKSSSKSSSKSSKASKETSNTRIKQLEKENNDPDIFDEKCDLVYKLEKLGFNKFSPEKYLHFELQKEFNKRLKDYENKQGVALCKKGLLLSVSAIEFANTQWGPEMIDLEGWKESFEYGMDIDKNWDTVLEEIYEKYAVSTTMPPEMRLLFMVIYSGASFAALKKIKNYEKTLSDLFSKKTRSSSVHSVASTLDSNEESRIPEPNMDLDLEKIMEQMKAAKFKQQQQEDSKDQEEIIVNIPKTKSGRGRGRPRGSSRQVILQ